MPRVHAPDSLHVARIQVVSTCIHLYRLPPPTSILYRRQNCRHRDVYPLVSGYKLLVRDTCMRQLHVSGVNAALRSRKARSGRRAEQTVYISHSQAPHSLACRQQCGNLGQCRRQNVRLTLRL